MVSMKSHFHFIKVFRYDPPYRVPNLLLVGYSFMNINAHSRWFMYPPYGTILMEESSPQIHIAKMG